MEQCFRIAFWMMFLLTGYLQAQPLRHCTDSGNLGLQNLRGLSCSGTMNFTSPVIGNVTKECRVAVMPLFIEGMQDAKKICTDEQRYIDSTIETLVYCKNMAKTECSFTMEVHEVQFGQFVDKMKTFFEEWEDNNSQKE